jgi:hypothetical protein
MGERSDKEMRRQRGHISTIDIRNVPGTLLPDGGSQTNKYNLAGMVTSTCGSRTYPEDRTYDSQGRMKTMTTWKDFAAKTGAATTTWNYDANRGWLSSKRYPDNKGPDYTYSAAGRLRTRSDTFRGVTTTYNYNWAGDLASVCRWGQAGESSAIHG